MSTPVGGVRYRLIKDNFENKVRSALDDLGWFDESRKHKPVIFQGHEIDDSQEVRPNLISVSTEDMNTVEWEMGSHLEEHRWDFYLDIYAENATVGLHLAGDIQDILKGKMPSINASRPTLSVLDLRVTTPTELFVCQLENVKMARVREWDANRQWQRYWWVVLVEVVDYYDNEDDE